VHSSQISQSLEFFQISIPFVHNKDKVFKYSLCVEKEHERQEQWNSEACGNSLYTYYFILSKSFQVSMSIYCSEQRKERQVSIEPKEWKGPCLDFI
jgi:hypothetical protein